MVKQIIYAIIVTVFLNSCSTSKTFELKRKGNVSNKEYITEMPFRYINNHIFIDVVINQKKYNFLFDTGAELTAIDDDVTNIGDLQFLLIGETKAEGNSIATQKVKLIEIPKISLSNIDFLNTGAIVLKIPKLRKLYSCFEINGIIGNNLMRKANWQIDYKNKIIRITDNIQKIKISEIAVPIKMDAKETGNIYFDLCINGTFSKFTFDTGSNWHITTSSKKFQHFQKQNKNLQFIKKGNQYEFIADLFTLDKINLKNQIITLENGNHSLLGNVFFENYILSIDWKNDLIYFDPINVIKEDKLSSYQLYFSINYEENIIVVNNAWAEHKLNFEVENRTKVLTINNVNVSNFKRNELCEYWSKFQEELKEGKELEVELKFQDTIQKVTLFRKQILPK